MPSLKFAFILVRLARARDVRARATSGATPMRFWSPLALSLIAAAAIFTLVQLHRGAIDRAVEAALAEADAPPYAEGFALHAPAVVLSLAAFGLVFLASSLCGSVLGLTDSLAADDAQIAMGLPVDEGLTTPYEEAVPAPGYGRWADGLWSCGNNGPLCLAGCCLPCVVLGQAYERVFRRRSCLAIVAVLGLVAFAGGATASACAPTVECTFDRAGAAECHAVGSARAPPACRLVSVASSMGALLSLVLLTVVRQRARGWYGIRPSCFGESCDDLCCAVWCGLCVPCQVLRHVGVAEGRAGYRLVSANGADGWV